MPIIDYEGVQSPREDAVLWRYMPLAKFLAMAHRGSIYLPRADQLGDEHEGALPHKDVAFRDEVIAKYPGTKALFQYDDQRTYALVSCWHESDAENETLWGRYCPPNVDGVAVMSNAAKLRTALDRFPEPTVLGSVEYIDYATDTVGLGRPHIRLFRKRREFAGEREVRAVVLRSAGLAPPWDGGEYRSVDLGTLLIRVVAKPRTPAWIRSVIDAVNEKLSNYRRPVQPSTLDQPPAV